MPNVVKTYPTIPLGICALKGKFPKKSKIYLYPFIYIVVKFQILASLEHNGGRGHSVCGVQSTKENTFGKLNLTRNHNLVLLDNPHFVVSSFI